MDWSSTDMAESIGLFKQKMNLFLDDENVTDNAAKARKICRGIGDEGLRRINASDLSPEQKQNPLELWTLFENQLKVNVNFRIHRLHLMKYRQTGDESIDDFVTRARTLANKCQFTENELNERLMELIIASTPYDGLRRELLGKPIGHTIRDVLKEGRKFEALSAGNDQLQRLDTKQSDIHTVSYVRKCGNCGTSHKPRQCPAYKDKCSACHAIGHWKACCRKTRTQQRPSSSGERDDRTPSNRHGNPRRRRTPSSHRKNSKVHSVDTDYETDGESYQQSFYAITVSTQCLDAIDNRSATRDEAFVVLDVQPPGLKGTGYTLRLKIDSGASGNTLPMRTFRQMYGNKADTRNLLEPANGIKLTAYNGEEIRCLGTLDMKCQHKSSGWKTTRFYVVDVPGPAVVGLPTSEILDLVTINVDGVVTKPNEQIAMHATNTHLKPILKKAGNVQKQISINSIEDLKQENQVINTKEPLMPHTLPTRPWQYIASDLFEINGKQYLLTVDRYTKYPLVDYMPNPVSSHAVTEKMKTYCAMFGRPDEIMTDGGPQYSGKQFKEFTKNWGICHTMSSPHYPRSNGFIERHVRHVKPIIRKTIRNGEDIQLTLLNLRATPIDTGLPSPAEMIFGRPIPTMLPQRGMPAPIEQRERFAQQQANMKTHHDQTSRHVDLPPLYKGQKVRILDKTSKTWCPGTVLEKCQEPRSYLVETPNGTRVRRNRSHLRDMTIQTRSVSFADEEVNDHPNSHAEHSPPHSTDNETRLMQNESTPNAGERRIPCTDNQTVDGDVRRKSCRAIRRPQRYDS